MQTVNFEEVVEKIISADARYQRDAYFFVREALDHTQKMIIRASKTSGGPQVRHVSGQELLAGIREYALKQYGPMAETLLNSWGVLRCEDFGEIVFSMVENRLLGKTEQDSRADFKEGYDFAEAFRKPFLPPEKPAVPIPKTS